MNAQVFCVCAAVALFAARPAAAAGEVHVAVGALEGDGGGTKSIMDLQGELKRLGLTVRTTRELVKAAEDEGVADRLPSDERALARIAAYLEIDAVVYGTFEAAKRGRGRRGALLNVTVHNGGDGAILGEHTFDAPGGRPSKAFWRQVATEIEPDIRRGSHRARPRAAAPPVEEAPPEPVALPVEPVPVVEAEAETEPASGDAADLIRLRAGLAFMSRSFKYTADDASPQFTDGGIQYDSSLAPGVSIEAELYPLALATRGFARDFGLGVRFEKVFLGGTKQEVTLDDGTTEERNLETSHQHFAFDLRYRHRFGQGDAAPELSAFAGLGLLDFELEKNAEYRGTSYRYWRLGLGAVVPFGTPLVGADVRLQYFPSADLGDTVEELGDSASTNGFGLYAGLASDFGGGLTAHAGFDLLSFTSDVKGEGREGRIGKSAEDGFLGFRVLAGYSF